MIAAASIKCHSTMNDSAPVSFTSCGKNRLSYRKLPITTERIRLEGMVDGFSVANADDKHHYRTGATPSRSDDERRVGEKVTEPQAVESSYSENDCLKVDSKSTSVPDSTGDESTVVDLELQGGAETLTDKDDEALLTSSYGTNGKPCDIATTSPISIKLARRTVAPLKFDNSSLQTDAVYDSDDGDDDIDFVSISDTSMSSASDDTVTKNQLSRNRDGSIRFHSYVKVVNIPSRFAYTSKQKRRMWNGESAIRRNAKRNKVEYEWEGWTWQNVIEEDKFDVVDGQLIHPAHTNPVA
jgi:hypothetical protein